MNVTNNKTENIHVGSDTEQDRIFKPYEADVIASGMKLTIFDGLSKPVEVVLTGFGKGVITFDRLGMNDIVLRSHLASRSHGQLRLLDGKCLIVDLNSTNGRLRLRMPMLPVLSYP